MKERVDRIRKVPWSRLLKPSVPVALPRYKDTAFRFLAAMAPSSGQTKAQGPDAAPAAASLCISFPREGAGGPLTLARLRPAALGRPPQRVRLRGLINCAEGACLMAHGSSVWVVGRLEGALARLACEEATPYVSVTPDAAMANGAAGAATLVESAGANGAEAPSLSSATSPLGICLSPTPAAAKPKRPSVLPRPGTEDEYLDWIEDYLRREGATSLRKLGDNVQRPKGIAARNLKRTLLKHRARFLIDVQNCVTLNRARRWRWSSQPMVSKRRTPGGSGGPRYLSGGARPRWLKR